MPAMVSNADNTYKVYTGNTKGKSSSGAQYVQYGYGQVEPNHLSAQRTGQIYAQLPANKQINKLENGQFVKYDYATGEVNFTGSGEWMLVYNEVKVYHNRDTDADFAMLKENYVGRVYNSYGDAMPDQTTMVPRVFKTNIGDIFTTNAIDESEVALKDELSPDASTGFLKKEGDGSMKWQVVKLYTLGDGQKAAKLMRIE